MKLVLNSLVLIILLTTQFAFAGGDLVNNGGGIAEKNIIFAYQRLENYLRLCLSSEFCKLDKTQRAILEQIKQGLPEEKRALSQIQFASEKNQPGFFIIDQEVKVAKTGSQIGSPIFINTDLLYAKNEVGYYIPTSVAEAVAILVHELGHHYGQYSHTDLDLIGVRVAMMLQHKTYVTPLLPWSQQISAMVINPDLEQSFPEILLYVEDQIIDISAKFKEMALCPKFIIPIPLLPIPDIPVASIKPLGSLVHNVHWNTTATTAAAGSKADLSISADLSHKCKRHDDVDMRSQDYRLQIDFSVTADANGKWMLDTDSIKLQQKHDAWWKIISFHSSKM